LDVPIACAHGWSWTAGTVCVKHGTLRSCYSGTGSDLQKELFNGASSKRKEGHAYTRSRLTVLAYQSTRDSGLPVSPTHWATGLKPLVDKDWAAVNGGGAARGWGVPF
jgi:hypothetical protein